MRTALRTAVATALLAGLAATPVLAAGTAFAADGPAAAPAAPVAAAETPAAGTLVRTDTFDDGTTAKVYKLGAAWYRAEIFARDSSGIGALETANRMAALDDNGSVYVLDSDGRTHHWHGHRVTNAKIGFYRLADGTVVELGKNPKDGRLGLQQVDLVTAKGKGFIYLYATNSVWIYGKSLVLLEAGGTLSGWIPGSDDQATPVYLGEKVNPKPPTTPPPAEIISGPTKIGECTVTEDIASSYGIDRIVTLTNDLKKGPKAVLKDRKTGKVLATADRAHPVEGTLGLKIDRADTLTPRFGQRTQGGDMPYRWNDFPKLPKGCEKGSTATPAPTHSATPAPTTGSGGNGGQTTVVPQGGVAAGAEIGSVEQGNSTALLASGAGAAAVVAAGLGFTAMRRRTTRG